MRRLLALAILLAVLSHPGASLGAEAVIAPDEVIADPPAFDGRTVTIEGEAIGEALRADGGHVWVNVLGEAVALGTWVPVRLAEDIRAYGRYSHTGDRVRVTGEFHQACERHGGDADVHALGLKVVGRGETLEHPVRWWKVVTGALGIAAAAGLFRYHRIRAERLPD